MEKIGPTNIWIVSPEGSSLGKKKSRWLLGGVFGYKYVNILFLDVVPGFMSSLHDNSLSTFSRYVILHLNFFFTKDLLDADVLMSFIEV